MYTPNISTRLQLIDFIAAKKLVDIRQMIEREWAVELPFFHQLTGIDHAFFDKYVKKEFDFELQNVVPIPKRVIHN